MAGGVRRVRTLVLAVLLLSAQGVVGQTLLELDAEEGLRLPLQTDPEDVVGLVVGTEPDTASFFGVSPLENRWWFDGLDLTDPETGRLGTHVPLRFLGRVRVDAGTRRLDGMGATGAVIELQPRAPGSRWRGSVGARVRPAFADAAARTRVGPVLLIEMERQERFGGDLVMEADGPVLDEILWLQVGFGPRLALERFDRQVRPLDGSGGRSGAVTEQSFLRTGWRLDRYAALTMTPLRGQRVRVSYLADPTRFAGLYRTDGRGDRGSLEAIQESGGADLGARWSGSWLADRLRIGAGWSVHFGHQRVRSAGPDGAGVQLRRDHPFVPPSFSGLSGCDGQRCALTGWTQGGLGFTRASRSTRHRGTLELAFRWTDALETRAGAELSRAALRYERGFTGGVHHRLPDPDTLVLTAIGRTEDGVFTPMERLTSTARSSVAAIFVEQVWSLPGLLHLRAGARLQGQRIEGGSVDARLRFELAPQVSLEVPWTAEVRPFIRYGRSHPVVPAYFASRLGDTGEVGNRVLRGDLDVTTDFYGPPYGLDHDGDLWATRARAKPFVLPGLRLPAVDEVSLGVRGRFAGARLEAGIEVRRLARILEDTFPGDREWVLGNPGDVGALAVAREALEAQLAAAQSSEDRQILEQRLEAVRGLTAYPRPRHLHAALVLGIRRDFRPGVFVDARLQVALERGNYPGIGTTAPHLSSQWDHGETLGNQTGPLPTDRLVRLQLVGSYQSAIGLRVSVRLRAATGTPTNTLAADAFGAGRTFLLPRGGRGRNENLYGLDLGLGYDMQLARDLNLTVSLNAFNVFDFQQVVTVDDEWTRDVVVPIVGGSIADLEDSRGVPTVRTASGALATRNPRFGAPLTFQSPRSFLLRAVVTF